MHPKSTCLRAFLFPCTNSYKDLVSQPDSLAPSPRITAYLARKGLYRGPSMALTIAKPPADRKDSPQKPERDLESPPSVVTTPADPWPRPYYFEDGLRKVRPYHFTYNTYCKERWRGRELLDVFATEFRDRPQAYYVGWTRRGL